MEMSNDYEALARSLLNNKKDKTGVLNKLEGLLNSEEGKNLARTLSGSDSAAIKEAAQAAMRGDEAGARDALAKILSTPEGAELFKKFIRPKR